MSLLLRVDVGKKFGYFHLYGNGWTGLFRGDPTKIVDSWLPLIPIYDNLLYSALSTHQVPMRIESSTHCQEIVILSFSDTS